MAQYSIDQLIINSPFEEPASYWAYHREVAHFTRKEGRRPAGYVTATGSGKTIVMAMLIAWQTLNRAAFPQDARFSNHVLVVAPGLTVRKRLAVLAADSPGNYYDEFNVVPPGMADRLRQGRVLVVNWHALGWETEEQVRKRRSVDKRGAKSDEAYLREVLGPMAGASDLLVINDEAHHAWRVPRAAGVEGQGREQGRDRGGPVRVDRQRLRAERRDRGGPGQDAARGHPRRRAASGRLQVASVPHLQRPGREGRSEPQDRGARPAAGPGGQGLSFVGQGLAGDEEEVGAGRARDAARDDHGGQSDGDGRAREICIRPRPDPHRRAALPRADVAHRLEGLGEGRIARRGGACGRGRRRRRERGRGTLYGRRLACTEGRWRDRRGEGKRCRRDACTTIADQGGVGGGVAAHGGHRGQAGAPGRANPKRHIRRHVVGGLGRQDGNARHGPARVQQPVALRAGGRARAASHVL